MNMKKYVLHCFSLILGVLIVCTVLSGQIGERMTLRVEPRQIRGSRMGEVKLGLDILFWDEQGCHLYEIVEGSGWQSGLRVQEISPDYYSIVYSCELEQKMVRIPGGKDLTLIQFASRQPKDGEAVELVEKMENVPDQYLIVYRDASQMPETQGRELCVDAQGESALLVSVENGCCPFLEEWAGGTLEELSAAAGHVYSMTDARQFFEQIPGIAALAAVLMGCVTLWLCCGFLLRRAYENRYILWLNAAAGVVLLCLIPALAGQVELPISLLPSENILDLGYYAQETEIILSTLEAVGQSGHAVVTAWTQGRDAFYGVLVGGTSVFAAAAAAEVYWAYKKVRR